MPKFQKNILIDVSLLEPLKDRMLKTGCSFAHFFTVALLRLLLESTARDMTDETWMSLAVQIHRGTLTFEDARRLAEAPSTERDHDR